MVHTGTNEKSSRLAQWVELIQDRHFILSIQTEKFAIFDCFLGTCKKLKYQKEKDL